DRSAGGVPGVAQLREAVLRASAGRDAGDAAGSDGAAAHGAKAVEAQEGPEPGTVAAALGGLLLAEGPDATPPQWHGASAEIRRVIPAKTTGFVGVVGPSVCNLPTTTLGLQRRPPTATLRDRCRAFLPWRQSRPMRTRAPIAPIALTLAFAAGL